MSLFDKQSDPYEDFLTLYDALHSLVLWERSFKGTDRDLEDDFYDLTAAPFWRSPIDHLKTFLPYAPPACLRLPTQKASLRKAFDLLQKEKIRTLRREFGFGIYHLYGYVVPRAIHDKRQPIPPNVWGDGAEIDWERSTVRNGSLVFESVRFIDIDDPDMKAQLREKLSARAPEFKAVADKNEKTPQITTKPKKKRGQPEKIAHVQKAYDLLRAEGKIDYNGTVNSNAPAISDKTLQLYPSDANKTGKGISVKTIRDAIGDQFEAEKKIYLAGQQAERERKKMKR